MKSRKHFPFIMLSLMIVSAGCTKTPPSDTNGIYNGDGKGGTNSSKPPVADAGPDQTITILSNYTNVTLDGSDSYDSIGHPIQYLWKQLYGPVNCSFSNPGSKECTVANINIPGVYSFELKVWNSGGSDFDTVDISILLPAYCQPFRPEMSVNMIYLADLPGQIQNPEIITAGNKLIIPAWFSNASGLISNKIYIYDLITQNWMTTHASLARIGAASIAAGNKVFFAGGMFLNNGDYITTSVVDIYDVSTNTWTTANLSEARSSCNAVISGNKILFAGGMAHSTGLSDRVDIYDLSNGNWTTSTLPSGKRVLSGGVASQDKVLFCGGITSWEEIWGAAPIQPSPYIDIFNINTGTWSIDSMEVKKSGFSTVNVNGTIFFAGGILDNATTFHVEKLHMATMNNTHSCLDQPKQLKNAVVKNENILFFTYNPFLGIDNRRFDIYNTQTGQWSVGVITDNNFFSYNNFSATGIASVNNQVYVATSTRLYKMNL